MTKLFLDDYRTPLDAFKYMTHLIYAENDWVVIRDYDQFVDYIEKHDMPDLISFDHDLNDLHYAPADQYHRYDEWLKETGGDKEKTGFDCAKWLCEYCMDNKILFPQFMIHSMNPVGAENIYVYIKNYLKNIENKEI